MALTQISTQGIKDGTITGSDLATNVDLVDNQKLRLGTGNDLQIYHDGSHSYIDESTGSGRLKIRTGGMDITSEAGAETIATFNMNGAVELYHDNSKKFETASHGATLTGNLRLPDNTSGNASIQLGDSQDFFINHNGTDSFIINNTGDLYIRDLNGDVHIQGKDNEESIIAKADGAVELYFDNSLKFKTDSIGCEIAGALIIPDGSASSNRISVGNAGDLKIFHDGSFNKIQGSSAGNHLILRPNDSDEGVFIKNNDAVELYFDGSKKFETTSSGATVTGSLGIGTTSPAGELHISSGTSGDCKLIIEADTDNSDENDNPLIIFRQDGGLEESAIGMGLTSTASDNLLTLANSVTNGGISFATGTTNGFTNAVERMRIDTSGRLGIGTSNPANMIHTSAANDASGIRMTNTFDSPDNVWALTPSISGVSNTGFTIRDVTDGRNCLVIDGIGRVSIGTNSASERLKVETTANTMVPMAINDSTNTSTFTHRLMFQTGGTEVGRIRSSSNATTYDTSISDVTLKKNFEDWTENTLNLFKNINPQKYNFIQEDDGTTKSKGFIAQEMVDSFPEAYSKEDKEDSKYYFNPSGMVVYLMKAIQELEAEVAALKAG